MLLISRLFLRPDFRRNPARAVWRRVWWRTRWQLKRNPWVLPLGDNQYIAVPYGGSGALIYYQGVSEPQIADFILRFLRPGMVFFDIGAHIGEYVLLAAARVKPGGLVQAFEPNPDVFSLLAGNIHRNRHENVRLNELAVSDMEGTVTFDVCVEPSISSLRSSMIHGHPDDRAKLRSVNVRTVTLDGYLGHADNPIDLIKIDVEGAELLVLKGAASILSRIPGHAPVIVFEYSPENYARFGCTGQEVVTLLRDYGYTLFEYSTNAGLVPFDLGRFAGSLANIVATKEVDPLKAAITTV